MRKGNRVCCFCIPGMDPDSTNARFPRQSWRCACFSRQRPTRVNQHSSPIADSHLFLTGHRSTALLIASGTLIHTLAPGLRRLLPFRAQRPIQANTEPTPCTLCTPDDLRWHLPSHVAIYVSRGWIQYIHTQYSESLSRMGRYKHEVTNPGCIPR